MIYFHQPKWSFKKFQDTSRLNKYPPGVLYHTLSLKSDSKLTQSGFYLSPQLLSNHFSPCSFYSSRIGPLDVPHICQACSYFMAAHGCSFCLGHSFPRSSPASFSSYWFLLSVSSQSSLPDYLTLVPAYLTALFPFMMIVFLHRPYATLAQQIFLSEEMR